MKTKANEVSEKVRDRPSSLQLVGKIISDTNLINIVKMSIKDNTVHCPSIDRNTIQQAYSISPSGKIKYHSAQHKLQTIHQILSE